MSITTTGDIVDTRGLNGDYVVGDTATGTLDVNGGSVLSITAPTGQESFLAFGRNSGISGSGTISGAGSLIEVISTGLSTSNGAGTNIGRPGVGSLTISNGGALRITDLVGTTYLPSNSNGGEFLNVGRGTGANGTLSVNAGTVELRGTGTFFNVGRDGGTGVTNIANGSTVTVINTIAASDANFQIGRDQIGFTGANGTMTIDASAMTLTGGGGSTNGTDTFGSYMQLGRGSATAQGTLTLQNNATLTQNGVNAALGTTAGDVSANIGRGGGTGILNVLSGSDWLLNGGTEGAFINIGRNGATGEATTGANGTLNVSGAGSTVVADTTGNAGFNIGRQSPNTGNVLIESGASVTISGDKGASMNVGFRFSGDSGTGGTGNVTVQSGGVLIIDNQGVFANPTSYFGGITIGSYQGSATVTISGAGSVLRTISSDKIFANIGSDGSAAGPTNTTGGTATLRVQNGGLYEWIDSSFSGFMSIGRGDNSQTLVEVLSGGRIDLDDDASPSGASVSIGDRLATNQSAVVRISGANSVFEGVNFAVVGRNTFDVNSTGGSGSLIVESGGVFRAIQLAVGSGGIVSGHNGTVDVTGGNLFVRGGQLGDNGGLIQTLNVTGDLNVSEGTVRFDVGAGAGNNDKIAVTGGVFAGSVGPPALIPNFLINAVGGFTFAQGEQRTLVTASNINFANVDFGITITGQNANFSYFFGTTGSASQNLVIEALNSGASGGRGVLDFGAASTTGANLVYDSAANTGDLFGGRFSFNGGTVVRVADVYGTDVGDVLNFSNNGGSGAGFFIDGRGGTDNIVGSSRDDTIRGGLGFDTLDGGAGLDTNDLSLWNGGGAWNMATGVATFTGVGGTESAINFERALMGGGNDAVTGTSGNDEMLGGGGSDFLTGAGGNDTLNGGADFDYANYLDATGSVTVSLAVTTGQAIGSGQGTDTLTSIEGLYGSQYGDTLTGDDAAVNAIYAWGGADSISGGGGFDYVESGEGDDTLNGGAGDDYLLGGNGIDEVNYQGTAGGIFVNLANIDIFGGSANFAGGADGFDIIADIENVRTGTFADFVYGSNGANRITTDAGGDVLFGYAGNDTLDGGADTDYIIGGIGADLITTGAGQDFIYFQAQNEGKDTITDWRSNGFDILVIDEPGFGGGLTTGLYLSEGANIGRFVIGTAATAAFGQFLWNSGTSTLSWDADGTGGGAAVQIVTLTGITTLSASDIVVL
jgi:hypothetical protein